MRFSRPLLLLLCFSYILIACKPQAPPPFCLPTFRLNEVGDTVERYRYEAQQIIEWERRDISERHIFVYGEGLLKNEQIFDPSGKLRESWIFDYNNQNDLIKRSHRVRNKKGLIEEVAFTSFSYKNGQLFDTQTFDPRQSPALQTAETQYEWDEQGLLVKMSLLEGQPDSDDKLRVAETRQFTYDNKINPFDDIGWHRIESGKHNLRTLDYTIFIYSLSGKDTSFIHMVDSLWYNYDEAGYPIQEMIQTRTGELGTCQIGYDCEE